MSPSPTVQPDSALRQSFPHAPRKQVSTAETFVGSPRLSTCRADLLDSVIFRVGLLAALRSKKLGGKVIGVMVTASHNPEKVSGFFSLRAPLADHSIPQDNGVKLVDPMGEMLHSSWEAYATQLANALSAEALVAALQQIILAAEIDLTIPATVVYGHDTRPSCPGLVKALEDGLESIGVKAIAAGLVTTPQLHYLVRCYNTQGTKEAYGEPTVEGYYQKLAAAYTTLAVRPSSPSALVLTSC